MVSKTIGERRVFVPIESIYSNQDMFCDSRKYPYLHNHPASQES